jgi:DNA-binding response OmpR family regulator
VTDADKIEDLQRQLRELKGTGLYWPVEWRLGDMTTAVLRLLAVRGSVTQDAIVAVLYGHRADPPGKEVVRQHIRRIRNAIKPLKIKTRWGVGYEMSAAHRKKLREIAAGTRDVTNVSRL